MMDVDEKTRDAIRKALFGYADGPNPARWADTVFEVIADTMAKNGYVIMSQSELTRIVREAESEGAQMAILDVEERTP